MFALAAFAIFQLAPSALETPYREPQLAASENLVALAFGAGQGVYVATSSDRGHTFSKPVQVAKAHVLPLNRHRGPRVVISKGTIIVTAVAGHTEAKGEHSHGLPSDGDLLVWRSIDGGKTWSKGVRINDVPGAPREGLHTLAADGRGNIFAAWLDLRTDEGHKEGTRLFGAYSKDNGVTWSANVPLYESPEGTICQCCHPSAAYTSSGQLEVMWRNCLGGSRDFYMIRSAGAGKFTEPAKLGKGTWKINACPMDGGGIAHDGKRTVTAWRRDGDVFLAEPGKAEVKIGEGKDIAVAASKDGIRAAWVKGTQLVSWHAGKVEVLAEKAAFPALAALPDGNVLAAWEENGAISVRLLSGR